MKFHDVIAIALISSGALIMLNSIIKYRANIRSSYHLFYKSKRNIHKLSRFHIMLMVFFLVGYLVVLYTIVRAIPLFGDVFVGVIFFFGAIFVLCGTRMQAIMFYSINLHHVEIIEKNRQLEQTEGATIFALANQVEMHDTGAGKHLERTSEYLRILAGHMAQKSCYRDYLTRDYIADLLKSAPLHDIGKVGVPDAILKKQGRLSVGEFEQIKAHCIMGASTLAIAEAKLGFRSFLTMAVTIARSHHERWNGRGYPDGLRGTQIPLSARMMAIVDVYDALRSERCYKKAFSHDKAIEVITAERGEHFDPAVVDAFLDVNQEIYQVSQRLVD